MLPQAEHCITNPVELAEYISGRVISPELNDLYRNIGLTLPLAWCGRPFHHIGFVLQWRRLLREKVECPYALPEGWRRIP